MPDACFADPRLVRLYDALEGERTDLGHYETIMAELGATRVVDVGCGTGELACRLANLGVEVVGADPAAASLAQARTKAGSDRVRWLHTDAAALPALEMDAAVLTGNAGPERERSTHATSAGETLTSMSTLRFRERDEIVAALDEAGFSVQDVRPAPDRPGAEFVFIARAVDGLRERSPGRTP